MHVAYRCQQLDKEVMCKEKEHLICDLKEKVVALNGRIRQLETQVKDLNNQNMLVNILLILQSGKSDYIIAIFMMHFTSICLIESCVCLYFFNPQLFTAISEAKNPVGTSRKGTVGSEDGQHYDMRKVFFLYLGSSRLYVVISKMH